MTEQQPHQDRPEDEGTAPRAQEGIVMDSHGRPTTEEAEAQQAEDEGTGRRPTEAVEHPAKVMRLGTMIKSLLDEVKSAPLDEAGRQRLAEIHRRSISELEEGLSPELVEELERITLPLTEQTPSEAELRIAQAQLVGWLEGLFHGIQTAIVAQQMAAQQQLQQMRRALPAGQQVPGQPGPQGQPGMPGFPPRKDDPEDRGGTGQYL